MAMGVTAEGTVTASEVTMIAPVAAAADQADQAEVADAAVRDAKAPAAVDDRETDADSPRELNLRGRHSACRPFFWGDWRRIRSVVFE